MKLDLSLPDLSYPIRNRTCKYLFKGLVYYGKDFSKNLDNQFKIGYFIDDENMPKSTREKIKGRKYIILIVKNKYKNNPYTSENFIDFLIGKNYFIDSYPYDDNHTTIVLHYPDENIYNMFLEGNYSQMYNDNVLKVLFRDNDEKKSIEYKTLSKSDINAYYSNIEEEFNVKLSQEDKDNTDIPKEYDFKIDINNSKEIIDENKNNGS